MGREHTTLAEWRYCGSRLSTPAWQDQNIAVDIKLHFLNSIWKAHVTGHFKEGGTQFTFTVHNKLASRHLCSYSLNAVVHFGCKLFLHHLFSGLECNLVFMTEEILLDSPQTAELTYFRLSSICWMWRFSPHSTYLHVCWCLCDLKNIFRTESIKNRINSITY